MKRCALDEPRPLQLELPGSVWSPKSLRRRLFLELFAGARPSQAQGIETRVADVGGGWWAWSASSTLPGRLCMELVASGPKRCLFFPLLLGKVSRNGPPKKHKLPALGTPEPPPTATRRALSESPPAASRSTNRAPPPPGSLRLLAPVLRKLHHGQGAVVAWVSLLSCGMLRKLRSPNLHQVRVHAKERNSCGAALSSPGATKLPRGLGFRV